jgi:4-amino-4-deoxy-L-arabinose transferase-like glycosyltransferase
VEALHTDHPTMPVAGVDISDVTGLRARPWMLLAWVASLVLLLAFLGTPPVQRTQEARVLVTAREMLQLGGNHWLIPTMNGRLRLEKPPLAYWLTAAAFAIGGVNEWAGRVPAAICGWLAIAVVCLCSAHFFDRRAAFFAVAALLGGLMFYRHVRLAETDAWVMLFDTCAIVTIWRGAEALDPETAESRGAATGWFLASGVFIALAALAKGVPALFVLLFLAAAALEWRDRPVLRRWLMSGAPIVTVVIGLAWYAYIAQAIGVRTFLAELKALRGEDHAASNIEYPPQLLRGLLPWTGFTLAAIVAAAMNWRRDRRVRVLLIWCASILLPLLLAPQKQYHYLMPLYPPLAILTGWFLAEATRPGADERPDIRPDIRADIRAAKALRIVLYFTLATAALAALAAPLLVRRFARGDVLTGDLALAGTILVGCVIVWQLQRRRGAGAAMIAFALFVALLMPFAQGAWVATLSPTSARAVAQRLARLSGGRQEFCFWGENISIPLVFELRRIVPQVTTEEELEALSAKEPDVLVLSLARPSRPAPQLPSGWERIDEVTTDERTLEVYRAAR